MANKKKNHEESLKDNAKAFVRKVFRDARQKVIFENRKSKEKDVRVALEKLGIAYYVGDMPYETSNGNVTYKHTLFVKDVAALQAILNETD